MTEIEARENLMRFIRGARVRAGISSETFAHDIGMTLSAYYGIEECRTRVSFFTASRIVKVKELGITYQDLEDAMEGRK